MCNKFLSINKVKEQILVGASNKKLMPDSKKKICNWWKFPNYKILVTNMLEKFKVFDFSENPVAVSEE